MLLALIAMTQALYSEPLRPQFHFTAQKGWLNDPNGLVFYEGEYHLFFQHNPFSTEWGNMTWGHAVSKDLLHWQQLPNAIEPDAKGTIYSGSAIVDHGNTSGLNADLIALYTAAGGKNDASKGQPFTQCLAYSRDKGRTWTKLDKPVINHIAAENRDPKVVWHAPSKKWVLALYLDGETFSLFTSPNLKDWTETQRLQMPGSNECPDFFEIPVAGSKDKKWIFTGANGRYWIGGFDGKVFRPEIAPMAVEFGAHNYAVQTYDNLKDRRVQIGWMNGGSFPNMPFNQQMTIPCDLTLLKTSDGLRLFRYPIAEIEKLWTGTSPIRIQQAPANETAPFSGSVPDSDLLDVEAEFEAGDKPTILHLSGYQVSYDPLAKTLTALGRTAYLAPEKGRIKLRVLLDRTSLEVFGNDGRVSLSTCKSPNSAPKNAFLSTPNPTTAKATARTLKSVWK